MAKFMIVDQYGSYVAGSISPTKGYAGEFAYPLIMGTFNERKLYPTREETQQEIDRTCSSGVFTICLDT